MKLSGHEPPEQLKRAYEGIMEMIVNPCDLGVC